MRNSTHFPKVILVALALTTGARNYKQKTRKEDPSYSFGIFGGGEESQAFEISQADPELEIGNSISQVVLASSSEVCSAAKEQTSLEISDFAFILDNALISLNTPFCSASSAFQNEIGQYMVQPGDNITLISKKFSISIDTILWANNLDSPNKIKEGQILEILPVSGIKHTIKEGDTLEKIAIQHKVPKEEIALFNSISESDILNKGAEIIIPGGKMPEKPKSRLAIVSAPAYTEAGDLNGYFIYPAAGHNWGRTHANNGVDISNSDGGPIYAAADGTVILADSTGYNGGYGKYIKIKHPNNVETLYAHLSKINVAQGQWVTQGTIIGLMGNTGRSTGTHLHFEVHGAKNPLAR
ncbi:MAG: peptidoglycan DD-metalloendopeptidase family protein [bacterium]